MSKARKLDRMWTELSVTMRRFLADIPSDVSFKIAASLPEGWELSFPDDFDRARASALRKSILPLMREIDNISPMWREPQADVWEAFHIDVHAGKAWATIENVMGQQEHVSTFVFSQPVNHYFRWCATRPPLDVMNHDLIQSSLEDTSWDAARRRRMVKPGNLDDQPTLVDPGAVRMVELAEACHAKTLNSCEGHTMAAYMSFKDRNRAFERAIETMFPDESVWSFDMPDRKGINVVRMTAGRYESNNSLGIYERDSIWRDFCAKLEQVVDLNKAPTVAGRSGR